MGTKTFRGDEAFPAYQEPTERSEKLFDITCVVGSVYSGGNRDPRAVAFEMIGELHHPTGKYTFPDEDGNIIHVTVDTEPRSE